MRGEPSAEAPAESEGSSSEDDVPAVEPRKGAPRWGELASSLYAAPRQGVYGHDLSARAWLTVVGLDATWLRLYEPSSAALGRLDFLRGAASGIIIAERYVEASVHLGADGMHGREWTPAFGTGAELRVYPTRRFTTAASFHASIFGEGNPLFDTKLEAGATFGRIDIRLGARHFYQEATASLLGPSASIVIRLGP